MNPFSALMSTELRAAPVYSLYFQISGSCEQLIVPNNLSFLSGIWGKNSASPQIHTGHWVVRKQASPQPLYPLKNDVLRIKGYIDECGAGEERERKGREGKKRESGRKIKINFGFYLYEHCIIYEYQAVYQIFHLQHLVSSSSCNHRQRYCYVIVENTEVQRR